MGTTTSMMIRNINSTIITLLVLVKPLLPAVIDTLDAPLVVATPNEMTSTSL